MSVARAPGRHVHRRNTDRRAIWAAGIAMLLAVVCSLVLPAINSAIPYSQRTRPGQLIDLGSQITFAPSPGWQLISGTILGSTRSAAGNSGIVQIADGDVQFLVTYGRFGGTAGDLLDRGRRVAAGLAHASALRIVGPRSTVTTDQGLSGVLETFSGTASDGLAAAFVIPVSAKKSTGVVIVARGATGSLRADDTEIRAMIDSLRHATGTAR